MPRLDAWWLPFPRSYLRRDVLCSTRRLVSTRSPSVLNNAYTRPQLPPYWLGVINV